VVGEGPFLVADPNAHYQTLLTTSRYYMSVLMSQVGFNTYDATYMSLVGGGALLIGTIPAIFLMETCGRRFWAIAMYQLPAEHPQRAARRLPHRTYPL
jgi:hypothetical protein